MVGDVIIPTFSLMMTEIIPEMATRGAAVNDV
jgi:hypothetical protein